MKSYNFEGGEFNPAILESAPLDRKTYAKSHSGLVIVTHDVFIEYKGGILLAERLNEPCKGELFPIGGRIKRGLDIEDSLRRKVLEESNLRIRNLNYLDVVRTYFKKDHCGHGKGTDNVIFVYYAEGEGDLQLDGHNENPLIVKPEEYRVTYRDGLHPYVRDHMDLVIPRINSRCEDGNARRGLL